jgi:hypothetical protein
MAVGAYQAALQELTRERVPLDWTLTQNNLGLALLSLGERAGDTARLEQAVETFQTALQELTIEASPAWHEVAQQHLTRSLALLQQRGK